MKVSVVTSRKENRDGALIKKNAISGTYKAPADGIETQIYSRGCKKKMGLKSLLRRGFRTLICSTEYTGCFRRNSKYFRRW